MYRFGFIILTFLCFFQLKGQIILNDSILNKSVAYKASIYEDPKNEITLSSIIKNDTYNFTELTKPLEIIDFTSSRWFIRFEVQNTGIARNILLETARPITNRVDLFEIQNGEIVQEWKSGDDRPFSEKTFKHRKNIFPINFAPNEKKSFYLILESDGEVINLPFIFWEDAAFDKTDYRNQLLHGFYFGMLAIVVFIFFFFYLMLKEISFLYYILYVFFQFMMQFSLEGFTFQYIAPNHPYWSNTSVLLSASGTLLFLIFYASNFLKLKKRNLKAYTYFKWIIAVLPLIVISSLIPGVPQALSYPVINIISLIATVSIVVVIFKLRAKGYAINNAFTTGFVILILGAVLFILGNLGVLGDAMISELSLKVSSGLEVLALSISMAGKYRELQEEKEKAQAKALENLEKIVSERTQEIEQQKVKIEEQHKDMLGSIKYAQRIQKAILPKDNEVLEILPQHFIFYQPRDIVSGDFYFIEEVTTKKGDLVQLFAAIDCTGHGVPGAFMSFLGNSILTQSTITDSVNTPAEALDFLNKGILEILKIRESNKQGQPIRDGMDMTLCGINRVQNKLYFAGAKNSILIVTSTSREHLFDFSNPNYKGPVYNTDRSKILFEVKGDRHPIGLYGKDSTKPFTHHEIPIEAGDLIYSYSDGYIDQFGGDKNKKFGTKQFKEFILNISELSLELQKTKIATTFDLWRGTNERLDDVLVMGVKI